MNQLKKGKLKTTMALAYQKENALNAICPYFTMFPLEYPNSILKKHVKANPTILDPFCGRGTTLFAARKFNLNAWGIDSSPVAIAIAKAKLASCESSDPLLLAEKLISENLTVEIPETPFFTHAFHRDTLRDVCALREGLLSLQEESDASVILRAATIGCLHGPLSKHIENASYFSNQMPRTYASKPDYAVKFWQTKKLTAPKINVLGVLNRKIERIVGLNTPVNGHFSNVIHGDSQSIKTFQSINTSPSIVITSPPYYGMRTYVQDQWLRHWFLGGSSVIDYSSGVQLNHGGKTAFSESLGSVWNNIARASQDSESLHMYIRFGIIPSAKVDAKEILKNSLDFSGINWKIVSTRSAKSADSGLRQADQMKTKSSAAIEFDFHIERY